ncbi:MAG: hypothetical protein ACUZ8I_04530 [Candidatus Scalindua sp.]
MMKTNEVMFLENGVWVKYTFNTYNEYKELGLMQGITAVMVLKRVKSFKTELNKDVHIKKEKFDYLSVIGLPVHSVNILPFHSVNIFQPDYYHYHYHYYHCLLNSGVLTTKKYLY